MTLARALTEEQVTIMIKSMDENYPLDQAISDIDLIADITEIKIGLKIAKGK